MTFFLGEQHLSVTRLPRLCLLFINLSLRGAGSWRRKIMSHSPGRCWDTLRHRQTPWDSSLSVMTRQSIHQLTAPTYRLRGPWWLLSLSAPVPVPGVQVVFYYFSVIFLPLTGRSFLPWLATISVLCFLCGHCLLPGAGSWLAQVSRNKRSRYGQFPYYPLSLQPGPGQIILEGDTGHGRPWEARGQFSLWGASPPARASPGGGINRTTENSRHGDQHGLHLQRLNKQKRYHRAYPPATLGSSRQIVTGILCCNYKVRLRAGYFDNISY